MFASSSSCALLVVSAGANASLHATRVPEARGPLETRRSSFSSGRGVAVAHGRPSPQRAAARSGGAGRGAADP